MKVSEDVLHNDAEMRQVAKLAEMYHEQKMKQTEKTRKQQQLLDSQKQQSTTTTTTASTSATPESNTSTSSTTTPKESKATRGRRKRKNEKEEVKTEQQPSPPLPEHVPTPVQANQPLFFDVEDPILKERFKNQLKRHNKLLESHKQLAKVQKEAIELQKADVGKRLMTRIYDQMNSLYDDSLFAKTHNMQLNRLAVIDRRATKVEMVESTKKDRELSLPFGDMADSPAMQREWSNSPLVQQQHPFEYDDEDEYDEDYDEEDGGLFGDHARMMQEMDDYDYTKERRTLSAVRQALKQHAKFSAESELDDEHSEVDKKHDVKDKALEAAIEAAVDRHMRRRKRAFVRYLKKSNNKKG